METYNIPGPGEPGNETWKGDSWKTGGGAPWYVGSYDPELDLIYYGTSNAAPWGGRTHGNDSSNIGQYPNLYTASQLALDPDDGKIVWSYQMTPADVWDYDGVNEGVLVNLKISNQEVPALVKADRNGFFYVLNRANGQLISAEPFVKVNWAERWTGKAAVLSGIRSSARSWTNGLATSAPTCSAKKLAADVLQQAKRSSVYPDLQPVHEPG